MSKTKLIINHAVNGYESVLIDDSRLLEKNIGDVVVVLDSSCNDALCMYYSTVRNMIINGSRVILINVGSGSKISKPISLLMSSYKAYDIYNVENINIVTKEYLDRLLERQPGIEEVEVFIGGDTSAYGEINEILLSIEDAISKEDIDSLREVVQNNINSLGSLVGAVDYMKMVVDQTHSGDTINRIEELKRSVDNLGTELRSANKRVKDAEDINIKMSDDLLAYKNEVSKYKAEVSSLRGRISEASANDIPVIKSYSTKDTRVSTCNVDTIIYFKEISQIPYINTFISQIFDIIKAFGNKVRLVIYDNKDISSHAYKLSCAGSSDYMAQRDKFIHMDKFVAVEPNQCIIEDILDCTDYNIVIIYDRLKQINDIVDGNNVYKFWVSNSKKEVDILSSLLRINAECVITRTEENSSGIYIDIPKIDKYSNVSSSGATRQYMQANSIGVSEGNITKKNIVGFITSKCNIEKKR